MRKCVYCGCLKHKSKFHGKVTYCKACDSLKNDKSLKHWRRFFGHIAHSYQGMIQATRDRQAKRPMPDVSVTMETIFHFVFSNPANRMKYETMYAAWQASGFDTNLCPSFDRLDTSKSYDLDNIQLITWKENNDLAHKAAGVTTYQYAVDQQGNLTFVAEFESVKAAAASINTLTSNIHKVCRGSTSSHGGYYWSKIRLH